MAKYRTTPQDWLPSEIKEQRHDILYAPKCIRTDAGSALRGPAPSIRTDTGLSSNKANPLLQAVIRTDTGFREPQVSQEDVPLL